MGNCITPRSFPEIIGAPLGKLWYHGDISDDEAEQRMMNRVAKQDGIYLVYDFRSQTGTNPVPGNYYLLVFYRGELYRWKISIRKDGRFILGEVNTRMVESYASVKELIKAHRGITAKLSLRLSNGRFLKLSRDYIINRPTDGIVGTPASHQHRRNSTDGIYKQERERPAAKTRRQIHMMN
jgi:hypothetical protein